VQDRGLLLWTVRTRRVEGWHMRAVQVSLGSSLRELVPVDNEYEADICWKVRYQ